MANNHHEYVLIAQGFWTPSSSCFLQQQSVEEKGVFVLWRLVVIVHVLCVFVTPMIEGLDAFELENLVRASVFGFFPFGMHDLGRSRTGVAEELVATSQLSTLPF
ncbi:hypothetical protein LY76DRAFT_648279 [Colletotrichum caudatum]|nr:hypothetical protein LY76DRAFT_648279 [Colletotrichum caudatum]